MLTQIEQVPNLNALIEQTCARFADKPAYSCLGQTLTFAEISAKAAALAAYYQSIGLRSGDRIVIQLPNLLQYPIAAYAALKAGLVIVNTNPLYTAREMQHQFADSGAKAIVILADLYPKLQSILTQTSIQHVIVTSAADLLSTEIATPVAGVAFKQALLQGRDLPYTPSTARLDDVVALQYTGGTTGVSKGAQLTHRNLIANAFQTADMLGDYCGEGCEVFVCPLPLYHIYAFLVCMVLFASRGNHSVLIPNPRDLPSLIQAIRPYQITAFCGLNTLFVGLCNEAAFRELDFSQLKLTTSGGTALTTAAANIWQQVTGCLICEGYGLSETSPVVSLNHPQRPQVGTVGEPLALTEVQFWDHDDKPVADGETGQLVVRGPQVMQGYWNMPAETAKALTKDGFFKTGDIGLRLTDGSLKIVDRLKDMIIVSGFNVYPNEVEEVLSRHPAVLEAAVVGAADERTGEAVVAYVTLKSAAAEADIKDFCREQLAAYKVPKKIIIMPELPKSSVGKILRRELRNNAS